MEIGPEPSYKRLKRKYGKAIADKLRTRVDELVGAYRYDSDYKSTPDYWWMMVELWAPVYIKKAEK